MEDVLTPNASNTNAPPVNVNRTGQGKDLLQEAYPIGALALKVQYTDEGENAAALGRIRFLGDPEVFPTPIAPTAVVTSSERRAPFRVVGLELTLTTASAASRESPATFYGRPLFPGAISKCHLVAFKNVFVVKLGTLSRLPTELLELIASFTQKPFKHAWNHPVGGFLYSNGFYWRPQGKNRASQPIERVDEGSGAKKAALPEKPVSGIECGRTPSIPNSSLSACFRTFQQSSPLSDPQELLQTAPLPAKGFTTERPEARHKRRGTKCDWRGYRRCCMKMALRPSLNAPLARIQGRVIDCAQGYAVVAQKGSGPEGQSHQPPTPLSVFSRGELIFPVEPSIHWVQFMSICLSVQKVTEAQSDELQQLAREFLPSDAYHVSGTMPCSCYPHPALRPSPAFTDSPG
jgi:hypothetical protein